MIFQQTLRLLLYNMKANTIKKSRENPYHPLLAKPGQQHRSEKGYQRLTEQIFNPRCVTLQATHARFIHGVSGSVCNVEAVQPSGGSAAQNATTNPNHPATRILWAQRHETNRQAQWQWGRRQVDTNRFCGDLALQDTAKSALIFFLISRCFTPQNNKQQPWMVRHCAINTFAAVIWV